MGQNHGLAYPDKRFVMLREDVFERACNGRGRDRLTVAHEIGHILLHTTDRIVLRRGEGTPKAYCNPEWQANCFAGEFLIAHELVRKGSTAQEVAAAFGVSVDAAVYQLRKYEDAGLV
jgi:Zn-dependent peptidase ImmA (M78 family)